MDPAPVTTAFLSFDFLYSLLSIILIDLILAGDNAVVIAMAVRSLPRDQRKKGILFGSAAAVALRIALTMFISQLLQVPFLKLTGGILISWIAVKLFVQGSPDVSTHQEPSSLAQAVRVIVVADVTMATDNMLGVAGASHGNFVLLLFGLGLSIPLVIFTSNLISMLMDKYPIIVYIGAAILGRVGGEMIITDPMMVRLLNPSRRLEILVQILFAVGIVVVGKTWVRWTVRSDERS